MGWVLDLDGVVWLADTPIAGAARAIAELQASGEALAFVTNNSYGRRSDVVAKLARHGIDAGGMVLTSAMAVAEIVEPDESVLVCGGPGVVEALVLRGCRVVTDGDDDEGVDAVVVGYDPGFDYARMSAAARAVRRGARLLATNTDATYPTPTGPVPGAGSILASIVTASGSSPAVAGKPHPPMANLVRSMLGGEGTVVGDRPETDGAFARELGYRFALVLSGVTSADDLPVEPEPDEVAADLARLVARRG